MCTVITLHRPGHAWPLLLAANRDEALARAWDPPAAYWPDHPDIIAGRDRTGGGTWMGINRAGLVAAVLNRPGSLGPAPGKRSRGELPLIALGHSHAAEAADAIAELDGAAYRSFNMVLADRGAVWFVRNDDTGRIDGWALTPGLHMVTSHDPDDPASARVARHLPRFRTATPPVPPDWTAWVALLGDAEGARPAALSLMPQDGFGTASASLLALPADASPSWLFAAGRAGSVAFQPVDLGSGERTARLL